MKLERKIIDKIDKIISELKGFNSIDIDKATSILKSSPKLKKVFDELFKKYQEDKIISNEDLEYINRLRIKKAIKVFFYAYFDLEQYNIINNEEIEYDEDMDLTSGDNYSVDIVYQYLRQIGSIPLLTQEEEIKMAKKIKSGDLEARKKFAEHNLRLVVSIAKSYINSGMDYMDLIGYGNEGLLKAIDKYDVDKGYKFSTYATWWIRQSISRSIADESNTVRIPVHMYEKIQKVKRLMNDAANTHAEELNEEKICTLTGYDKNTVQLILKYIPKPVSLEKPVGDEEDSQILDFIPNNGLSVEEEYEKNELKAKISEVLKDLDTREREVIIKRFGLEGYEPKTLEEVGKEYNVTRERIRQIEKKALTKLDKPKRKSLIKDFYEG